MSTMSTWLRCHGCGGRFHTSALNAVPRAWAPDVLCKPCDDCRLAAWHARRPLRGAARVIFETVAR